MVRACAGKSPRIVSRRLMVGNEILLAAARFFCSHRSNARAARTCSLVTDCYLYIIIPQVLTNPEN